MLFCYKQILLLLLLSFFIELCRVYNKTEQIWNRSQRRKAAQSMKFLINIDCLGTYDVE